MLFICDVFKNETNIYIYRFNNNKKKDIMFCFLFIKKKKVFFFIALLLKLEKQGQMTDCQIYDEKKE